MVYNNLSTYLELMDKKNKYKYVCLFGAGYAADSCWYQFVIDRGFNVNFFSDNDKNKWGKVIVDNIICIPPNEILRYGKDVLCLVSTSVLYIDEIVLQLKSPVLAVLVIMRPRQNHRREEYDGSEDYPNPFPHSSKIKSYFSTSISAEPLASKLMTSASCRV